VNSQQKSLTDLLLESEPPTAAEASRLHVLCQALALPIAISDLVERYAGERSRHEEAADAAKESKKESSELWETLQKYIAAGGDMFDGEARK
jgi:hypothetical protein